MRNCGRELEALGHCFHSLLRYRDGAAGVSRMGYGAFKKLRGMFAAALWTQSKRRLVLVRDRLGIKPLYFAKQNGNIYFGSEVKRFCIIRKSGGGSIVFRWTVICR